MLRNLLLGMDKADLQSPTEGHTEEGLEGEGEGRALEEGELAENEHASKEHESAVASEGAGEESSAPSTAGVGSVNLSVQLNVNVSSSSPSQPTANTYNKKSSFFDNLKSGENNKYETIKQETTHYIDIRSILIQWLFIQRGSECRSPI